MASLVYHSRSGYYFAQFYNGHQNPTRKTVFLKTKKKRIAERALGKLEDAVALGEFDPWEPKQETADELGVMGVAVRAYLESCSHLKANTLRTYGEILIPFQMHLGANYKLTRISVRDIISWLDSTSANDVTRRKYANHLGYFFRFLVR